MPYSVIYPFTHGYGDLADLTRLGPFDTLEKAMKAVRNAHRKGVFDIENTNIYVLDPDHRMISVEPEELEEPEEENT